MSVSVVRTVADSDPLENCLCVAGEAPVDLWWCVEVDVWMHLVEVKNAAAHLPSSLNVLLGLGNAAVPPGRQNPAKATLQEELEGRERDEQIRGE